MKEFKVGDIVLVDNNEGEAVIVAPNKEFCLRNGINLTIFVTLVFLGYEEAITDSFPHYWRERRYVHPLTKLHKALK